MKTIEWVFILTTIFCCVFIIGTWKHVENMETISINKTKGK